MAPGDTNEATLLLSGGRFPGPDVGVPTVPGVAGADVKVDVAPGAGAGRSTRRPDVSGVPKRCVPGVDTEEATFPEFARICGGDVDEAAAGGLAEPAL